MFMSSFKKFIALILTIVFCMSVFSACGARADKMPNNDHDESAATQSTEENFMPENPTLSEKERLEMEKVKNQNVKFGQLIIHNPQSNIEITLESKHFKDVKDIIDIESAIVKSASIPFITDVKRVGGNTYITKLNAEFCHGDTINIKTDVNVDDEHHNALRFNLHADEIDLNIDAEGASVASVSLFDRCVKITGANGSFFYDLMEMKKSGLSHIMINGFVQKGGDVTIYCNGNVFIVVSTKPLNGLNVMTAGFGDKPTSDNQNANSMESSCMYEIIIDSSGGASIFAQ
jgi:hypothetical protein